MCLASCIPTASLSCRDLRTLGGLLCVCLCVQEREREGGRDQVDVSRRHGVIAAEEHGADNSCDWSLEADCQPITLTSLCAHKHTHTTS